jgi:hypothetical protein
MVELATAGYGSASDQGAMPTENKEEEIREDVQEEKEEEEEEKEEVRVGVELDEDDIDGKPVVQLTAAQAAHYRRLQARFHQMEIDDERKQKMSPTSVGSMRASHSMELLKRERIAMAEMLMRS